MLERLETKRNQPEYSRGLAATVSTPKGLLERLETKRNQPEYSRGLASTGKCSLGNAGEAGSQEKPAREQQRPCCNR